MSASGLDHLAVIMDGNGRWAQRRRLPRFAGHRAGARALRRLVARSREIGVPCLTVYAFSAENWARPAAEVEALMELLSTFLIAERPELIRHQIELQVLGDLERLPERPRRLLAEVGEATRGGGGMRLGLALSYGGRDELVRAARRLAGEVASGSLCPEAIDARAFGDRLDTGGLPDVDLLIRTGGEQRLSNFLPWQAAYAELYFMPTLWPDFSADDLDLALEWYRGRRRTFGSLTVRSPLPTPRSATTRAPAGP